jgi:hypothetical protein
MTDIAENRRRGWALVVLGALLTIGMGFVAVSLGPSMLQRDGRFTGTAQQAGTYLVLFGLVILFGLNALIGGIRMIRSGQRSWWTIGVALGLVLIIAGVSVVVFQG